MSGIKISQLANAGSLTEADLFIITQNDESKVINGTALKDFIGNTGMTDEQIKQLNDLIDTVSTKPDGLLYENEYLYLTANGEVIGDGIHIVSGSGGGGGGSENNAVMTLERTTDWMTTSIVKGADCNITFKWSSLENNISTGNGSLFVYVNGVLKITKEIPQGDNTIGVGDYLPVGNNTIKIQVKDLYDNARTLNFSVNVMDLRIESSFDNSTPYQGAFSFSFKAFGELTKKVYLKIDGVVKNTMSVTTTGRQSTFNVPAQKHGAHTLEAYFECTVNEQTVTSNKLFYDIICIKEGNETPIITSSFNKTTGTQYENLTINYYVYNPTNLYSAVDLYAGATKISSLTNVSRAEQVWVYMPQEAGDLTLKIVTGAVSKEFNLTIAESNIDVTPSTDSLKLYLSSQGRSNTEDTKSIWEYEDIKCQLNDFNYSSDGWVVDNEGLVTLRLRDNARVVIPYKPFEKDCKVTGKTIEIEFATRSVINYDTVFLSCMDSAGRGFKLTPQKAIIKGSQNGTESIYKDEEHIRMSFVIEKSSDSTKLIKCYINGVMCNPTVYADDEDFAQITPQNIVIGANECVTDIYCIRIYDNALTRYEILDNWIYDTQDGALKADRYNRNNIYDAYGNITISKLPIYTPYMVFVNAYSSLEPDAVPGFPQSKADSTYVTDGYFVDRLHPEKNFSWEKASIKVQGTSSQFYPRKNYKLKFAKKLNGEKFESVTLADGTKCHKYALRDGMIEEGTFTLKADVASSEGCNNTELVRFYNDTCVYKTPYQKADSRCRQGIDGFPMVIFYDDGEKISFIGKYNFNLDKSDNDTWGFQTGDESWETLNNTGSRALFKSDDFEEMSTDEEGNPILAWLADYESRYPEENDDGTMYTDGTRLKAYISWVMSTDPDTATNEALSEAVTLYSPTQLKDITYTTDSADYRLAKFRAELGDHANVDDLIFYYLYTELFLMIDSRAKNAFPTIINSENRWLVFPYDMDTGLGINNEGALVFSPYLEDIDDNVFNGQTSTLWCNLRKCFYPEMKAMYTDLRSRGVWTYDLIENAYAEHQKVWGEAVFNEDGYFKYLQPLEDGNGDYLYMAQGDKAQQRKWWLYNRFKYMDSKYIAGDALKDSFTIRAYEKNNFKITPFHDMYIDTRYTSNLVQVRGKANTEYEMVCPLAALNDSECYIYNISQVKKLGDLSGFKVGLIDVTNAVKLTELKIGDSDSNYSNPNLTTLSFGNKPMLLRELDVRNCPNLVGSVDMSNCAFLETVHFAGTGITGVKFPTTNTLKNIDFPDTVTNLTLINQQNVESLVLNQYTQLASLRVEQPSEYINGLLKDIINDMVTGTRLRLVDFTMNFESSAELEIFVNKLDTLKGLDENGGNVDTAQLVGIFYVKGAATGATIKKVHDKYPNATIIADSVTITFYFYGADKETLLYSQTINKNDFADDPVATGKIDAPTKESTVDKDYTFKEWSVNLNKNYEYDQIVFPIFTESVRKYTARFYNGSILLEENQVEYGSCPSYSGNTDNLVNPNPIAGGYTDYKFLCWEPSIYEPMYGDTNYYAQYKYKNALDKSYIQALAPITKTFEFVAKAPSADDGWETTVINNDYSIHKKDTGESYINDDGETIELYDIQVGNMYNIVIEDCTFLFENFTHMTTITMGTFNTSFTDSFANMFSGCTALTTIEGMSGTNIKTNNITSMFRMFYNCQALTNIDVSGFITDKVESFNMMFYNCKSLTSLNISNFSFAKVKSCSMMFYGCENIESITFGNAYSTTDNQINMMFFGCSKLKKVDLSTFNFNTVTMISSFIDSCSSLTDIDLGKFDIDISKISDLSSIGLKYRDSIVNIYVHADTPPTISTDVVFKKNTGLKIHVPAGSINQYKAATNWCLYADYFVEDTGNEYVWSKAISNKIRVYNNIIFSHSVPDNYDYWLPLIAYNADDIRAYISGNDCTVCGKVGANDIYTPKDSSSLFELNSPGPVANWRSFTFNNFNTSRTTVMQNMFSHCVYLNSIDLSNFDTSLLGNMYAMFSWDSGLKTVNFGENFDSSRCENFGFLFFYDKALESVDWEHLNGKSLKGMDLFLNCGNSVKSVDLKTFDMTQFTSLYSPFYQCEEMTDIDLGNFAVSSVTNFQYLFASCPKLTSITIHSATPATLSAADIFPKNTGLKIYIPVGSANAYKTATNWAAYADYFEEKEGVEPIIFE